MHEFSDSAWRINGSWNSFQRFSVSVFSFFPLSPYMFSGNARTALWVSVILTLAALLVFGYVKGRFTGARPVRSALQTMLIGGLAAAAAFAIAQAIS